jgi:hypothetical protein
VDGRANDYVDNTGADDDVDNAGADDDVHHTCDHHFNATAYYDHAYYDHAYYDHAYYDHAGACTARGRKMYRCCDASRRFAM